MLLCASTQSWLRSMKEPLVPAESYDRAVAAGSLEQGKGARQEEAMRVLLALPPPNRCEGVERDGQAGRWTGCALDSWLCESAPASKSREPSSGQLLKGLLGWIPALQVPRLWSDWVPLRTHESEPGER